MTTVELAYTAIEKLVSRFKGMSAAERRNMNENATRQGYILPLFQALGWDTININEVSPEEKVSRGWVDFSFRISGVPRFFLETKKAAEDLNDPRWVKQAIDYAWTKSVTWALLSDFEGTRVFNAEWKEENPFRAQFFEFDLDGYLTDFERLWWLSREQTALGRLDTEAEKVGKRSKREPVNQILFADLKTWRADLFKDLRGFNPMYSPAQADEAVLRLLNRLIFLRTAEDRKVEENHLRALVRELKDRRRFDDLWKELSNLFREMDRVYNSELFAPHVSEGLYITPVVLEEVIEGLYEKNFVRYNFNAMDADVLGTVYEQYLGSMVKEDEEGEGEEGKQPYLIDLPSMSVQERRRKRKSQGIYYTPAFVTKYIVRQTVGRWLDEHGYYPDPPRVLDMACGSGSFLIEAFDVIDAFVARQRGHTKGDQADFFDHARQLEVLRSCIFGVDKDLQAVEVARLNLLLRALHSREKLPMLENIHHGDSLRPETWEDVVQTLKVFVQHPRSEAKGAKTFRVSEDGMFDIIIGNPPYVRQETLGQEFKEFAREHFETYAGTADLYIYFIEQAHKLLKPGGLFGMIVSNKWMRSNYGKALRDFLVKNAEILEIIDFGELPVFGDVLAYPVIIISRHNTSSKQNFLFAQIDNLEFHSLNEEVNEVGTQLDERALFGNTWTLAGKSEQNLFSKLIKTNIPLGEYFGGKFFRGVVTGNNNIFVIDKSIREKLIILDPHNAEIIKPYLLGRDVQRYKINFQDKYLIFTRRGINIDKFPSILHYLSSFKEQLEPRPEDWQGQWKGRKSGKYEWYEIQDTIEYFNEFEKPKIIAPAIVQRATFAYDMEEYYSNDKTLIIPSDDLFLLGILNSKISDFILKQIASTKHGGYFEQKPMYVSQLPIHRIDFDNPVEKAMHGQMVTLVEAMLALQQERQSLRPEEHLDSVRTLERKIQALDEEIDQLAYRLYGLTPEEIAIVEGKG